MYDGNTQYLWEIKNYNYYNYWIHGLGSECLHPNELMNVGSHLITDGVNIRVPLRRRHSGIIATLHMVSYVTHEFKYYNVTQIQVPP